MANLYNTILNIIKQGFYSKVDADLENAPSGEVTTNGKISKFVRLSVYGVISNPTSGSHALLFNSQGRESNKFGILNDFINRIKGLKEGEIGLNNTKAGTYILLKEDGSFEILGSGDYAVRYNELETAFNQLKSDFNNHVHGGVTAGGATTLSIAVPSTADITPARIEEIILPSVPI